MSIPKFNLSQISSWANVFSWIVLVFHILYFAGGFIVEIQNGGFAFRSDLFSLLISTSPLVSGVVFFIILQAISIGAQFLIETGDT